MKKVNSMYIDIDNLKSNLEQVKILKEVLGYIKDEESKQNIKDKIEEIIKEMEDDTRQEDYTRQEGKGSDPFENNPFE